MKAHDSLILLSAGLGIWIVGTIYFALRGRAILESGSLRYWISFWVFPIVSAVLCISVLRWLHVPSVAWAAGMLLLALPGMAGEALVLSHFSTFMPRLQQSSDGRYGALLFAAYAVTLGIAEVVTLQAKP